MATTTVIKPTSEQNFVEKFFDSPANRTGLILWAATAIASVTQYYLIHDVSVVVLVTGILSGLIKIIMPDNSISQSQLAQLFKDGVAVFHSPTGQTINAVLTDVEGVITAAVPSPTTTTPTTTTGL